MNYKEAKQFIEEASKRGSVLGLITMQHLLDELGHPEDELAFIHVGGTNGKGSVSSYIASVLSQNDFRVGRYVSPAVFSESEKIQYEEKNGKHYITEDEFTWTVCQLARAISVLQKKDLPLPTVFEIETAMAFLLFKEWSVDYVVLEVGLGGREDATNVVKNVVATVFTPISLDHTLILGDTIEKIAREKAGIIKENHKVISLQKDEEVTNILTSECEKTHSSLEVVSLENCEITCQSLECTSFTYKGKEYKTTMIGSYQIENACLAIKVCEKLGMQFIQEGIVKTVWPGRFSIVRKNPLVIFDGAHNVAGAKALKESIQVLLAGKRVIGVFGVFADKEYQQMADEVVPLLSKVIVTTAEGTRALPAEELAVACQKHECCITITKEAEEAYQAAIDEAEKDDAILVFGTLSLFARIGGLKKGGSYEERKQDNIKADNC